MWLEGNPGGQLKVDEFHELIEHSEAGWDLAPNLAVVKAQHS